MLCVYDRRLRGLLVEANNLPTDEQLLEMEVPCLRKPTGKVPLVASPIKKKRKGLKLKRVKHKAHRSVKAPSQTSLDMVESA